MNNLVAQAKRLFLVKQFERMFNDNGNHDKTFFDQELKLQNAKLNLKKAVDAVVKASTELQQAISLQDLKRLH